MLSAVLLRAMPALAQDFQFDSSMSRPVLENYLDRSISFTELLHDDLTQPRNLRGVDPRDNLRLILSSKCKFVGRALMVWGREKGTCSLSQNGKALRRGASQGRSGDHPAGRRVRDRDPRRGIRRHPRACLCRVRPARREPQFPVSGHALRQRAFREPLGRRRLGSRHEPAGNADVVLLSGQQLHRRRDRGHPLRPGRSDGQERPGARPLDRHAQSGSGLRPQARPPTLLALRRPHADRGLRGRAANSSSTSTRFPCGSSRFRIILFKGYSRSDTRTPSS